MTENLKFSLTANTVVIASKNDGSTFSWTPTSCGTFGACAMNRNTVYNGSYNQWYYSWYAATAGEGTTTSTDDINGSICPAGWKLPYNYTISSVKSYSGLFSKYGMPLVSTSTDYISVVESVPLDFSRFGYYHNGGGVFYGGIDGAYWSSSASDTINAYGLLYLTSRFDPQFPSYKYDGFNIRCVSL